jgi:ribulose 1,5-bisphosphate carboxylase large subunit-like protein
MLTEAELRRFTCTKGSLDPDSYIFVRYVITAPANCTNLSELAVQIALASSLGTVKKLPFEDEAVRHSRSARVVNLGEDDKNKVHFDLAIPVSLCPVSGGLSHLYAVLCYPFEFIYADAIWIEDIELPKQFVQAHTGPPFGRAHFRQRFNNVARPLFGVITKPRLGVPVDVLRQKMSEALTGGADVIVEDELVCDASIATFRDRVQRMVALCNEVEAKTGRPKGYVANASGGPASVAELTGLAKELGALAVQVNSFTLGLGGLSELVLRHRVGVPLIDCSIGIGIWSRLPRQSGVSESVWAFFSRLAGADAYYTGIPGRHVWYTPNSVRRTTHALTGDLHGKLAAMPVAASGINPANVWTAGCYVGSESLLLAGTGILSYPEGPRIPSECILRILEEVSVELPNEEAHKRILELGRRTKSIGKVLDSYGYERRLKT